MTQDLKSTYTIRPARYAKNKTAIHCKPDGTGWKTLTALIISDMPGVAYSNRENSYICSPGRAQKFETKIAEIQQKRNADFLQEPTQ